jgi:salicylate hydroxylase
MPARPVCAIVGAGIGGLTLALALQQRGFPVAVFERAKILSETGAGLLLSPNAVSILHELGLRDDLAHSSVTTPIWRILDTHGRKLMAGISLRWGWICASVRPCVSRMRQMGVVTDE